MFGNLVAAGASLLGGFLNRGEAEKSREATQANLQAQMGMQKEFAQQGIRWRVKDALKAGVHPLYALGANTSSYTPSSVSFAADNSMGNALASAGQDVGRAINATRTAPERDAAFSKSLAALQLENAGLDVEIKKTQLASSLQRLKANSNPPIPSDGTFAVPQGNKAEEMPPLMIGGQRVVTNPNTSNMEDIEKRYGDEGPVAWAAPLLVAWQDFKATYGSHSPGDFLKWLDQQTSTNIPGPGRINLPNFGRRW